MQSNLGSQTPDWNHCRRQLVGNSIQAYDQMEHDLTSEIHQKGLILPNPAQKSTKKGLGPTMWFSSRMSSGGGSGGGQVMTFFAPPDLNV